MPSRATRRPRHQDVVVHPVEELLQIEVHHDAAPLLAYIRLRLEERPGRKPKLELEKVGSMRGSSTCAIACCTSRPTTVGIPSCRIPPPGLGISTPRTALGV
jgi:hypothetical protein